MLLRSAAGERFRQGRACPDLSAGSKRDAVGPRSFCPPGDRCVDRSDVSPLANHSKRRSTTAAKASRSCARACRPVVPGLRQAVHIRPSRVRQLVDSLTSPEPSCQSTSRTASPQPARCGLRGQVSLVDGGVKNRTVGPSSPVRRSLAANRGCSKGRRRICFAVLSAFSRSHRVLHSLQPSFETADSPSTCLCQTAERRAFAGS